MAAPTIGTYTEKKIANQINILTKRLDELENNMKTPPFVIIYGVMDIPSEFTTDWKAHVNHILALNNINPNWILSITKSNTNCPYFVSINFISHCIKETVFNIPTLGTFQPGGNFKRWNAAPDEYCRRYCSSAKIINSR